MHILSKKKILLIDDEKDFALIVKLNLEDTGQYEVTISNNGKEGLEKAKQENPNLVILDLMLPGLPGEEVCRELKRGKNTHNIPIIMLTGKDSDTDRIVGRVIGADHYIVKPIENEELIEVINKFIR